MHTKLVLGLLLAMTIITAAPHMAHAERGSGSTGTSKAEDSVKNSIDDDGTPDQGRGDISITGASNSNDDDGTPDQGKGDFDMNGNPSDDSDNIVSDDDGTPDQGRGDFDAAGNPIDNSDVVTTESNNDKDGSSNDDDDSFFKSFRAWFSNLFSWWN